MENNEVLVVIPIEKSNPVAVEKICLELYKKMNFSKYKDFKRDLKEWVQKNIPELGSEDDVFIKIMTADYHLLQKYKDIGKSENFSKKEEKISKYLIQSYGKIDSEFRKKIIDLKNITVCPYCNRNYINSIYKSIHCSRCNQNFFILDEADKKCPTCKRKSRKKGKPINTAQLDHFFPKNKYPLFAVSFYNLIPSCYSCNHVKLEKELKYSPYNTNFRFDDVKFTYIPKAIDDLEIKISSQYSGFKQSIKDLGIEELYQSHIDVIDELLWKKEVYTDEYKQGLSAILDNTDLKLTNQEIDRFITGYYINKEDYGKRPLSKMVADISREIGLIGGEQ